MFTSSNDPRPEGNLTARAPFGTSQLNVYDQYFNRVASATGYLNIQLPQGIYQVETISGSQSERKLVVVSPDHPGEVTWNLRDLQIPSAAPLAGTSTTHEWHEGPAAQYSRQLTMQGPSGANSRLFIFVRTLEPQRYTQFDQGLKLYDAHGSLITDFKQDVWRDPNAGCLALTVDLPSGFYQLYRGGRGRKARYQAIWLSEYWETQVFIPAREYPMLSDTATFMARRGNGFNPNDELALATETVLDGLQRGINLTDNDMMRAMLSGKFENPWLGVLALHTMRLDPTSDTSRLSSIVEANVRNLLGDHPDARALFLRPDQEAERPFDYPPMLYASLRLVQEHATLHASTIPPESMTANLLDYLIADSPWVSWRTIENAPHMDEPWEGLPLGERDLSFPEAEHETKEQQFHELLVLQSKIGGPALEDLALLAEQARFVDTQPEIRYPLDIHARLMSLKADEVSQLTGLPLSRVEKALARLQTEPGRLEYGKLGKTEQTIAQMVQKPARRIQPPEGTLSIQQLQSTLLATINNLEQLPSRSKELRQQCLEWAAKLMAINTSLDERQDGILIVTNRGEVVYANRACQLLTATTREQLKADSQTTGNSSLQALDRANFGLSQIELPVQNGSQISVQLLKIRGPGGQQS